MKTLLTLIAFLTIHQVSANVAQDNSVIKTGDVGVSQATAKLISVKEFCPKVNGRTSCKAAASVVTLKVSLNGCLDRLGGYSTRFEMVDGKGVLYFAGVNIINRSSQNVRCITAPVKTITVQIPNERVVEVVNLDFTSATVK
jgi:hypothetical protein